jgi:hypothetical protein
MPSLSPLPSQLPVFSGGAAFFISLLLLATCLDFTVQWVQVPLLVPPRTPCPQDTQADSRDMLPSPGEAMVAQQGQGGWGHGRCLLVLHAGGGWDCPGLRPQRLPATTGLQRKTQLCL